MAYKKRSKETLKLSIKLLFNVVRANTEPLKAFFNVFYARYSIKYAIFLILFTISSNAQANDCLGSVEDKLSSILPLADKISSIIETSDQHMAISDCYINAGRIHELSEQIGNINIDPTLLTEKQLNEISKHKTFAIKYRSECDRLDSYRLRMK